MKTKLFLLTLFMASMLAAQTSTNVEDHQFKINFLAPAFQYEKGIQKNSTLVFELGTGFIISGGSNRDTDFGVFPFVEGQYRYYYNMKRRQKKGKRIYANTGNYLAPTVRFTSGNSIFGRLNLISEYNLFLGGLYGFQRTSRSGFNFGVEFGAGYFENDFDNGFSGSIDFSIGWVLGMKKKKVKLPKNQ